MSKYTKYAKNYGNSSWWMDDWDSDIADSVLSTREINSKNLYKMAAHRRAIANFVSIVTNQAIPVRFSVRGDSYTDGKTVTISSKIVEPSEFDPAVGLALHEGSHIKLSNFALLRDLLGGCVKLVGMDDIRSMTELSKKKGIYFENLTKDVLNWVEDRRIDQFIFNQAPGYRDYYRAMYDKYFNDPAIDKGLKSDEYTDETLESYMFRLINLQSKSSRIGALKELGTIYKIADLKNISRLKSTEDALGIALQIVDVILNAIPDVTQPQQNDGQGEQGQGEGENGEGQSGDGNANGNEDSDSSSQNGKSPMTGDMDSNSMGGSSMTPDDMGDFSGGEYTDSNSQSPAADTNSNIKKGKPADGKLSDRQKQILDKKIEKQKDFINGDMNKTKVSASESNQLKSIEDSQAEMKVVGQDYENRYGTKSNGIECIVVKKMSSALMEQNEFPLTSTRWFKKDEEKTGLALHSYCQTEVAEGIRLGTMLGKKLQTRSESRETVFNRQAIGKIDKRMISSLGFGNEFVFFTREIDTYKKANLHITVDASGSMGGTKWKKTMTNVVALCKAVDMIPNLSIQVSFRTTYGELPYIVMAYDSRIDKFTKVKNLFQYLNPNGTTPEGLTFEAIMKMMVASSQDVDSYFLNISDGEPYFHGKGMDYSGFTAAHHTKKMVDKIEGMGIRVLSYFVSDYNGQIDINHGSGRIFKESYGKAASFINVTNVTEVTRTMNKLFMEKPVKA